MLAYNTNNPKKAYKKVFLVGKFMPAPPEDPLEPPDVWLPNITENFLIRSSNDKSS